MDLLYGEDPESMTMMTEEETAEQTHQQWQEFDAGYGKTRKCGCCHQVKKISDFPMAFGKSTKCKVCVLVKKRGFKCMPQKDTVSTTSSEELGSSNHADSDSEVSASAPFSIGFNSSSNNHQTTPPTKRSSFTKRLSWSGPPAPPIMVQHSQAAEYA